jgi:hypothetical protein
MAGLKVKCPQRLKASSLLEIMVALVVIFTVFAIATGLYTNVMRSSFGVQQTMAKSEVERLAQLAKAKQLFLDEHLTYPSFSVEKTVKPWGNGNEALVLHFIARNGENKVLSEYQEIVLPLK